MSPLLIFSSLLSIIAFSSAIPIDAPGETPVVAEHILQTIDKIDKHNANPAKTFSMKFSHISALTPEQYNQRLGFKMGMHKGNFVFYNRTSNANVPSSFDWRQRGVINRVKDQGQCGSCYAFASVAALEGQHAIVRGSRLDLSEQNVVDCSRANGNSGCGGGGNNNAYEYMWGQGVDTEQSYPYAARDQLCRFNRANVGETMHAYVVIPENCEDCLKEAVAERGPVAVGIDAGHDSFQHYGGGVYYEPSCRHGQRNHAVLVVGYGTDSRGGDYWIVKNSWGTGWGEGGYIRMARNRGNNCDIAADATFPLI